MNQLTEEINLLKKQKDAIILAHFYVNSEVKAVADLIGDSYYLAKAATKVPQSTIVLCGVTFMGESAKLLNPPKTVLLPDKSAACPMANMYSVQQIDKIRRQYEDLAVVCYINSTAELKSCSDVCITSSNALKVVGSLPHKNIYFIPDSNLGSYVASQLPEKHFIFSDGFCYVHTGITPKDVAVARQAHPFAKVLVHPECTQEVTALADYVGSTSGILDYATDSEADEFIVCTEAGILYDLELKNPNKAFYLAAGEQQCSSMKRISLEKIRHVLVTGENAVVIDDALQDKAAACLNRMLQLAN